MHYSIGLVIYSNIRDVLFGKKDRDASFPMSVVSFKSTKRQVDAFIVSYVGYRFITACN